MTRHTTLPLAPLLRAARYATQRPLHPKGQPACPHCRQHRAAIAIGEHPALIWPGHFGGPTT